MTKHLYRRIVLLLFIFLMLIPSFVRAEEYVEGLNHWPVLTLQRALEIGLSKNLDLKIEALNVPIGKKGTIAEDAVFDPEVDAAASAGTRRTPTGSTFSGDDFSLQRSYNEAILERSYNGEAGLSKKFRFGLDGRLSLQTARDSNNGVIEGLDPEYRSFMVLNLTQPLLRDFGTAANTADLRLAKTRLQQAVFGVLSRAQRLAANIETTYYEMAQFIELYGYRIESRELAERLLAGNREKFATGVIPITEVQEAETAVASRDEQVLAARQQLETVGNRLKDLLEINRNDPMSREFFRTQNLPQTDQPFPALEQALPVALINRPELEQQRLEIISRDIRLEFSRNQTLPRLDLDATVGVNGLSGDNQSLGLTNLGSRNNPQSGNYWDSVQRMGEGDGYEYFAGVRFSYPLGNRGSRARLQARDLEKKQALYGFKRLETSIETEVINGLITANRSLERIKVASRFEELADKTLSQEMERLKEGFSDTFRILDFQDKVIDARIRKLTALADFNRGLVELYLAMGTNLERLNIDYTVDNLESTDATK